MSKHITIKGIYRNNKTNVVGVHIPTNNTSWTSEHYSELLQRYEQYLLPNFDKFNKFEVTFHEEGKQIYKGRFTNEAFGEYPPGIVIQELFNLYHHKLEQTLRNK